MRDFPTMNDIYIVMGMLIFLNRMNAQAQDKGTHSLKARCTAWWYDYILRLYSVALWSDSSIPN